MNIDKRTCEYNLLGRWTNVGCVINSRVDAKKKKNEIYLFPLGVKRLPIVVDSNKFKDVTTEAGKWRNIHTFIIKP